MLIAESVNPVGSVRWASGCCTVKQAHECNQRYQDSLRLPETEVFVLQNTKKKYYNDSQEAAPWKWFKDNPDNPYKVALHSP